MIVVSSVLERHFQFTTPILSAILRLRSPMPTSPRLSKALQELEQEIARNRPRVETLAPNAAFPNGYQRISLRDRVAELAIVAAIQQLDRTGDLG